MPRSIVHLLLAVLLLFTQQLSQLHGLSHWGEARVATNAAAAALVQGGIGDDGDTQAKAAAHDLCAGCAASAQLAFALPATARLFVPPDGAAVIGAAPNSTAPCLPTACGYLTRGPPRAG